MSIFDLGLLPSGHLYCFPLDADDATDKAAVVKKAFARSVGEGLFTLAARKNSTDLTPSLQYWRRVEVDQKKLSEALAHWKMRRPVVDASS